MARTIQHSVKFKARPEDIFDIYMDSRKHGEAIGSTASISRKVGGKFRAFDGWLYGRNLAIVPNKMIVQAWRCSGWKKDDTDSILTLTFHKVPGGSQLNLVHANVPDQLFPELNKGWSKSYWKPWKSYLKASTEESRKPRRNGSQKRRAA
jgi:activator of HSP90 ATPase